MSIESGSVRSTVNRPILIGQLISHSGSLGCLHVSCAAREGLERRLYIFISRESRVMYERMWERVVASFSRGAIERNRAAVPVPPARARYPIADPLHVDSCKTDTEEIGPCGRFSCDQLAERELRLKLRGEVPRKINIFNRTEWYILWLLSEGECAIHKFEYTIGIT